MNISGINIQCFRNIKGARLRFAAPRTFILGGNGQGKTNLLEALGYISALRSFRLSESRGLIQWDCDIAQLRYLLELSDGSNMQALVTLSRGRKQLSVDGAPVERLSDFMGRCPVVTLSSQDIQLLRGGPSGRRRFLDMALASINPRYMEALRRYHLALKQRNSLLKQRQSDRNKTIELIASFDKPLAVAAVQIMQMREEALAELDELLQNIYAQISGVRERPGLSYEPDSPCGDEEAYRKRLEEQRDKDMRLQITRHGPHRDDMGIMLLDHSAREYGSEGQQRGLVIALRLAQLEWYAAMTGEKPVLLADDTLGELDPRRRERFWNAIDEECQIFATGTTLPDPLPDRESWEVLQVAAGTFQGG